MAWNQGAAIFTGGIRVKLKEEEATEQAEAETEMEIDVIPKCVSSCRTARSRTSL